MLYKATIQKGTMDLINWSLNQDTFTSCILVASAAPALQIDH